MTTQDKVNFRSLFVIRDINHKKYSYGPLINHRTARFEDILNILANVMGNFTNICYSLALCHQLHQCYISVNVATESREVGSGILTKSFHTILIIIIRFNNPYTNLPFRFPDDEALPSTINK